MISKNKIKILKSLNTKKGRLLHKIILIEGKRLIEEILFEKNKIIEIWSTKEFEEQNSVFLKKVQNKKINSQRISNKEIKSVTNTINPQGVIAVSNLKQCSLKNIQGNVIVLDNISDPGNLGTIMRSAAWFGINNILLSNECVDPYNSKVIRSGMGAHFRQNIVIDKLENLINKLYSNDYKLFSADLNSENSLENIKINKNEKWGIILGNEAHGLSKLSINKIKYSVKIPQVGAIESLNVAVVCGIFLYEMTKGITEGYRSDI